MGRAARQASANSSREFSGTPPPLVRLPQSSPKSDWVSCDVPMDKHVQVPAAASSRVQPRKRRTASSRSGRYWPMCARYSGSRPLRAGLAMRAVTVSCARAELRVPAPLRAARSARYSPRRTICSPKLIRSLSYARGPARTPAGGRKDGSQGGAASPRAFPRRRRPRLDARHALRASRQAAGRPAKYRARIGPPWSENRERRSSWRTSRAKSPTPSSGLRR